MYGAGIQKLHVVRLMQTRGIKIHAILDTFRQGSYRGIPVVLFSDFLRSDPDPESWFVISAPSVEWEIRETLEQHFPKENIFSFETTPYVEWIPDVEQYRAYLLEHWDAFSRMHDALSDEKSKETLVNVIKGRISGKTDYFRKVYAPDTYYPADIIRFAEGEVLAELGSYRGETLREFLKHCPGYRSAYCFEPDVENLRVLRGVVEEVQQNGRIKIIPKGAWDCRTTLRFSNAGGATNLSHVTEERGPDEDCIETVTVDDAVGEPITYLKLSVNGAEPIALRGAVHQITANRPKICVCVSYSGEAVLDLWNYLRQLVPEYRFYLRQHCRDAGVETFLYAI